MLFALPVSLPLGTEHSSGLGQAWRPLQLSHGPAAPAIGWVTKRPRLWEVPGVPHPGTTPHPFHVFLPGKSQTEAPQRRPGGWRNRIFTLRGWDFLRPTSDAAIHGKPGHHDTILPDEPGSGQPKITEASGTESPSAQQLPDWGPPQGKPHVAVGISTSGNKSGALSRRPLVPLSQGGAEARLLQVQGPHGLCRWGAKLQAPGKGLTLGEHSRDGGLVLSQ